MFRTDGLQAETGTKNFTKANQKRWNWRQGLRWYPTEKQHIRSIFLLLHYIRKSLWALCIQMLSYATNIDTHRKQTVLYEGRMLYEATSLGFEGIYSVVIVIP